MNGKTKTAIAVLWFLVLLSILWMFVPSVSTTGIGVFRFFNPDKVYLSVEPSLDTSVWPLAEGAAFVDQYTDTKMVFGSCHRGNRCVTIRINNELPITIAGRTSWTASEKDIKVEFNPSYADKPHDALVNLVSHELGHAFGIHSHNPLCTSVMYTYLTCGGGTIPPHRFTPEEVKILERH